MSKDRGRTQTTTQTSQIPAWVEEGARDNLTIANDLAAQPTASRVAPWNPTLALGTRMIELGAGAGTGTTNAGVTALQGEAGFRPQMVTGASIGRGAVRDVTAGSLNGMDLSGYFNPWEDNVVNVALADIGRQGDIAGNAARARSAAAGVFGDRRDVLEAETGRGFADAAARTAAGLRSQGFARSQDLATTDLNRALQADMANQGVDLNVAGQNAAFAQQAALSNQSADAQGAALRSQIGQQLIGAGVTQQDQALRGGQAVTGVGEMYRENEQAALDDPYRMLALRQAALSGTPFSTTQITNSPLYRNTGAGILGGAATGAAIGRMAGVGGPWGAAAGGLLGLF